MRKIIRAIIPRKTNPTTARTPMNTMALILLVVVIAATLAFLVLLLKLSLDDADFWLKVMSGVLAAFTFLSGAAALVTGHILGNRQAETILSLEKGVADARTTQAEAERKLEAERGSRINLEEAVAPQFFPLARTNETLRQFAGTKIVLEFINVDSFEFARQIASTLQARGWEVVEIRGAVDPVRKIPPIGVQIFVRLSSKPSSNPNLAFELGSAPQLAAGEELAKQLNAFGVHAETRPMMNWWFPGVAEDAIVARVGMKAEDRYFWNRMSLKILENELKEETDPKKREELERRIGVLRAEQERSPQK